MYNIYKRVGGCMLLLLLIGFAQQANGQQKPTITNTNGTNPFCPGKTYSFTAVPAAGASCNTYSWEIEGGQLTSSNGTNSPLMSVVWNDIPGGTGTTRLRVTVSGCNVTAANGFSDYTTAFVQSLSQTTPAQISINGGILFGDVATITLSVALVKIPQPSGQPDRYASGYSWVIPNGWRYADGSVSNGTTPKLLNTPNSNSIQVTPSAGGGGTATVRAVDTACGSNNPTSTVSSTSRPSSTTITRTLPTVRIVSNNAPNPITCGDRTNYGFRAEVSGAQSGGTFIYSWSAPSWTVNSPTSQTPGIIPSGGSGTTISLQVTYSRNGATTALPVSPVTFNYSGQTAAPVFTQFGDMCKGTTRTFAVAPVPGATSYTWQFPTQFSPSAITTTAPQVTVTSGTTSAVVYDQVSVSANSGGCPSGKTTRTFNSGSMLVRIITPYGSPTEVCQNTPVTYQVEKTYHPPTTGDQHPTYKWTVDGRVVGYGPEITVLSPPPGQWTSIRVDAGDDCVVTNFDAVGLQSVSQINGQYCVDGGPYGLTASPTTAYPNPANNQLTVPLTEAQTRQRGEVRLYNDKGKLLKHVPATDKTITLDVGDLPEGLYQLETPSSEKGKKSEQQTIQIKH